MMEGEVIIHAVNVTNDVEYTRSWAQCVAAGNRFVDSRGLRMVAEADRRIKENPYWDAIRGVTGSSNDQYRRDAYRCTFEGGSIVLRLERLR